MTPDRRLDQLEPLMAEQSAQLDLHTAQLRRIATGIQLITDSIHQQSDNISFLLNQQAGMKSDIAQIKSDVAELKSELANLQSDMTESKAGITELKQLQLQQGETLTTILMLLQGRLDN